MQENHRQIIERIEYVRRYLGLNKSRFSTEIGLKPQTYNNFIGAQASKPSVDLILGVTQRFAVDSPWLLHGEGVAFRDGRVASPSGAPSDVTLADVLGTLSKLDGRVTAVEGEIKSLKQRDDMRMAG